MNETNTRNTEIDYTQSFEATAPLTSLVNETYEFAEKNSSDDVYQKNGRLNVELLLKNAKILMAAGDTRLAKNIFRTLIESGEAIGAAYAGMGAAFEAEKKNDLAVKAYREAIIFEPSFGSLNALAEIYSKQSDYPNAIGTLLRASNLPQLSSEKIFEIHKNLANCYMHTAQLNNAEVHYRKAYEINPRSDALHVNIGSLALKKNDPATAVLHFKEAIRHNPNNTAAHTGTGLAQIMLGNKEQAHDSFVAALKIDIHEVPALYNLVRCAYEIKKFDAAECLLREYIKNSPVNSNLLFSYAGILYHQGQYELAGDECTKLLSFNPDHEGARKILNLVENKKQKETKV